MHCSIEYNEELKTYLIKDHASQNGTLLNDQRLSEVRVVRGWGEGSKFFIAIKL